MRARNPTLDAEEDVYVSVCHQCASSSVPLSNPKQATGRQCLPQRHPRSPWLQWRGKGVAREYGIALSTLSVSECRDAQAEWERAQK